jgi:NitT/TauT family transport system permease protein
MKALNSTNEPVSEGAAVVPPSQYLQSAISKWYRANIKTIFGLVGVAGLLLLWQIVSTVLGNVIVATPVETFARLIGLLGEASTWGHILITAERLIIGLAIGLLVGLVLGMAAGLNKLVGYILEPLRWLLMTVPAIVITILAMLWFGMGGTAVIIVASLISIPIAYVNVKTGITEIDGRLLEMGQTFKFPRKMILSEIYIPGISTAIVSAVVLTIGMGVRVIILAELMAAHNGIGYAFSRAWNYIDAPSIFAWILMAFILLAVLEFGIISPVQKRLLRWNKQT